MENMLLPAVVAGCVFVVFVLISLKTTSGGESNRKKALLGQMMEETKANSGQGDVNLFKDTPGSGTGFLGKIPGISHTYDLLITAGLWDKRGIFFAASFVLFAAVAFALRGFGPFCIIGALAVAYFLPQKYLGFRIESRNEKFLDMFPDAIDLITRSVRSGHPINTAIRMISENMESPVRDEFRQVADEVSYGRTLTEALKRMAARLKIPDVDFFVVVLSVQQETGGSLTEVLSNLSNIIRKRKQLRAKIHAMTSEGRATAYILGAIPVLEFTVLYFMTPAYLEPLFTTFNGNILLGAAGILIIASQVVIRRMIDIDI